MAKYVINYHQRACDDDGGISHDQYWARHSHRFTASNDQEASEYVENFIGVTYRCNGGLCGALLSRKLIWVFEEINQDSFTEARTLAYAKN